MQFERQETFDKSFHASKETPQIEREVRIYSGREIERKLFGKALSIPNYILSDERDTHHDPYAQHQDFLKNHGGDRSLKGLLERRGSTNVFKEDVALALALNIHDNTSFEKIPSRAQLPLFSVLVEKALNVHNKDDQTPRRFSFIPTGDTALDFDYGADAIVHTAVTEKDYKQDLLKEKQYVSIGITSFNKKEHPRRAGKNEISSDVELFVSSEAVFIDRLAHPLLENKSLDPLTIKIIATFAQAIMAAYEEKLAGNKHPKPRWIDAQKIAKEFLETRH